MFSYFVFDDKCLYQRFVYQLRWKIVVEMLSWIIRYLSSFLYPWLWNYGFLLCCVFHYSN